MESSMRQVWTILAVVLLSLSFVAECDAACTKTQVTRMTSAGLSREEIKGICEGNGRKPQTEPKTETKSIASQQALPKTRRRIGPVIKGLQLGMLYYDAQKVIENFPGDNYEARIGNSVVDIINKTSSKEVGNLYFRKKDGVVTGIRFGPTAVDELFNVLGTSVEQFANEFGKHYGIKQWHRYVRTFKLTEKFEVTWEHWESKERYEDRYYTIDISRPVDSILRSDPVFHDEHDIIEKEEKENIFEKHLHISMDKANQEHEKRPNFN